MYTRKNAIRVLLVTIVIVVLRMIWDVHSCLKTGGKWNAQKQVCELEIKKK
ncbi:hypothetical protein SHI21_01295 [Bacteriovorax sp. PP10]|uniref:Uncharacterized protein n=1 Tax=Bacteriovorax antarcticus TaxID=3088717 RepID=A0ABU5VP44_9BACT|nr:hypothetical protein [Bacteriovorax sp. PP10]MEA9354817.1 hypothetical protein [Bacteriovorax sp. PP10]